MTNPCQPTRVMIASYSGPASSGPAAGGTASNNFAGAAVPNKDMTEASCVARLLPVSCTPTCASCWVSKSSDKQALWDPATRPLLPSHIIWLVG